MLIKILLKTLFCYFSFFWLFRFDALAEKEPAQITEELRQKKGDQVITKKIQGTIDLNWMSGFSGKPYIGLKCGWFLECEDMCRDIYERCSIREDCKHLHPDYVKKLKKIDKIFENPHLKNLQSINSSDLKIFLEIDSCPLEDHIRRFTSHETKEVLIWIAREKDIAKIFLDYDEYRLLEGLLKNIKFDVKKVLKTSFFNNREGMFNFIIKIIESDNSEEAFNRFNRVHDFFS